MRTAAKSPTHTSARLDPPTLARLDELVATLTTTWHKANRSDAIRAAVLAGLDAIDKNGLAVAVPSPAPVATPPKPSKRAAKPRGKGAAK